MCLVDTEMPGKVQSVTQFELKSGDYQVIQRVNASGETTLWFSMVIRGGKGYQALLEEIVSVGLSKEKLFQKCCGLLIRFFDSAGSFCMSKSASRS